MGDLGLMLDQPPKFCLTDALEKGAVDESKLQSVISQHSSGVHILTCATSPEMSDEITCDHLVEVIGILSTMYDYIVVDIGRHLDDRTVDMLIVSDEILLLGTQDVTTVRNVSRYLRIFQQLDIVPDKIHLVVNRYHKRSRIPLKDLEAALEIETFWSIPNDYEPISNAIDSGVPVVIEAPRSKSAQSITELAEYIVELRERSATPDSLATVQN
jgi:pilus assembly protein CpaE